MAGWAVGHLVLGRAWGVCGRAANGERLAGVAGAGGGGWAEREPLSLPAMLYVASLPPRTLNVAWLRDPRTSYLWSTAPASMA